MTAPKIPTGVAVPNAPRSQEELVGWAARIGRALADAYRILAVRLEEMANAAVSEFLLLQDSTPGTQQTGYANISGNLRVGTAIEIGAVTATEKLEIRNASNIGIGMSDAGSVKAFNNYASNTLYWDLNRRTTDGVFGDTGATHARFQIEALPSLNGGSAFKFFTGTINGAQASQSLLVDGKQNIVLGTAALATTATDGFLYLPTCAGAPSGTPTAHTGRVPLVVDSTNFKLYGYIGGAWRDLTGA